MKKIKDDNIQHSMLYRHAYPHFRLEGYRRWHSELTSKMSCTRWNIPFILFARLRVTMVSIIYL